MRFDYTNYRHFNGPLADALKQCCSVTELRALYQDVLCPALGWKPSEGAIRKELVLQELVEALQSASESKLFFAALPPRVQTVYRQLAWDGDIPLTLLEEMVGFPIATSIAIEPKHRYGSQRKALILTPEFSLIAFGGLHGSYHYGSYEEKEDINVCLPPSLRTRFRKLTQPLKGYEFEPVPDLPKGLLTYRCDESIQEELRLTADYIHHGHLQRLASGKIQKSCLKALQEMLRLKEFFSGEKTSPKLASLRLELLTNVVYSVSATIREALLAEPPNPAVLFRELLEHTLTNRCFIQEYLLLHLKDTHVRGNPDAEKVGKLWKMFAGLSTTGWTTFDNLKRYQFYREIPFDCFCSPHASAMVEEKDKYSIGGRHKIDLREANKQQLMIAPLLQGTAFVLGALGFAEIAYSPQPKNPVFQRGGEDFLTPWDGLYALRLTPLGAYAFKQTKEVTLKASTRKRAEVFLNPNRLTVTSRNIDPVTELSLLEFMERFSEGCYRMTRKSFLSGCSSEAAVRKRVELFKKNIAAEPPAVWQAFLDKLSKGAVALRKDGDYVVYKLTDTPDLRQLFFSDPLLNEKTLKVEGLKIAIKKTDLPAILRRLDDLGYLLD